MARNASDIFCLRDPKEGENDGTQMFSVNGACSMRINRKKPPAASFQYGSTKAKNKPKGSLKPKQCRSESSTNLASKSCTDTIIPEPEMHQEGQEQYYNPEEYQGMEQEEPSGPYQTEEHSLPPDTEQEVYEEEVHQAENVKMEDNSMNASGFVKVNPKRNDNVSLSSMSRNPITGCGMEPDEVMSRKRGFHKKQSPLW